MDPSAIPGLPYSPSRSFSDRRLSVEDCENHPQRIFGLKRRSQKRELKDRKAGKMDKGIYRKKSIDRVSSPEQLDGYIQVVTPGVWLILGAVLVLLGSVLLWSVTGTIDVTMEAKGYSDGSSVYCYLDEAGISAVSIGMEAYIGNQNGSVAFAANVPEAYAEAAEFLGGDAIAHALHVEESDWKYRVAISAENIRKGICHVSIVTERVNPISYLLQQ